MNAWPSYLGDRPVAVAIGATRLIRPRAGSHLHPADSTQVPRKQHRGAFACLLPPDPFSHQPLDNLFSLRPVLAGGWRLGCTFPCLRRMLYVVGTFGGRIAC